MTKQLNPDVAAFKDEFFKGLSFRECLYGGGALFIVAGGILLLHFYFAMDLIRCPKTLLLETGSY